MWRSGAGVDSLRLGSLIIPLKRRILGLKSIAVAIFSRGIMRSCYGLNLSDRRLYMPNEGI